MRVPGVRKPLQRRSDVQTLLRLLRRRNVRRRGKSIVHVTSRVSSVRVRLKAILGRLKRVGGRLNIVRRDGIGLFTIGAVRGTRRRIRALHFRIKR